MVENILAINENYMYDGYLLDYSEMGTIRNDAAATSRFNTAGQELAWSISNAVDIVRNHTNNNPKLWIWDDMVNPYHNAHDEYFLANGTVAGSWDGLDHSKIGVMTWQLDDGGKSLQWFAAKGLKQIVAGYYDTGNGTMSGEKDASEAKRLRNI